MQRARVVTADQLGPMWRCGHGSRGGPSEAWSTKVPRTCGSQGTSGGSLIKGAGPGFPNLLHLVWLAVLTSHSDPFLSSLNQAEDRVPKGSCGT